MQLSGINRQDSLINSYSPNIQHTHTHGHTNKHTLSNFVVLPTLYTSYFSRWGKNVARPNIILLSSNLFFRPLTCSVWPTSSLLNCDGAQKFNWRILKKKSFYINEWTEMTEWTVMHWMHKFFYRSWYWTYINNFNWLNMIFLDDSNSCNCPNKPCLFHNGRQLNCGCLQGA